MADPRFGFFFWPYAADDTTRMASLGDELGWDLVGVADTPSNAMARITALAAKHRLPAVYWLHTYPEAGGLMSYGADLFEVHRRSAFFVDRVLRGARPADLPVEEPSKLVLVVNLKAARALGLMLPPSVVGRASQVIE